VIYDWPTQLAAVGFEFDLLGQTIAGPITLAQTRQVGSFDGGYWLATLSGIAVVGKDRVLAFRRLRALLQGGANQLRVPVCDKGNAPWPGSARKALSLFSDGVTFSDGTSFSSAVVSVVLGADAALRATRIVPTVQAAAPIYGGEYFSIGDHLYQVAQVLVDGSWQIVPPLREAVPAGTDINFDHPVCVMTLVGEEQMNLALERQRMGVLALTLFESFAAD
jgi:hypothetical protein